jgi:hypothetical protein
MYGFMVPEAIKSMGQEKQPDCIIEQGEPLTLIHQQVHVELRRPFTIDEFHVGVLDLPHYSIRYSLKLMHVRSCISLVTLSEVPQVGG